MRTVPPPVVIDALDDVGFQLELGDDCGRDVNPAGTQLGKTDRLLAGLAQSLQQPLCRASASVIDELPSSEIVGASSASKRRCCHRTVGD